MSCLSTNLRVLSQNKFEAVRHFQYVCIHENGGKSMLMMNTPYNLTYVIGRFDTILKFLIPHKKLTQISNRHCTDVWVRSGVTDGTVYMMALYSWPAVGFMWLRSISFTTGQVIFLLLYRHVQTTAPVVFCMCSRSVKTTFYLLVIWLKWPKSVSAQLV